MITTSTVALYTAIAPRWIAFIGLHTRARSSVRELLPQLELPRVPATVFLLSASILRDSVRDIRTHRKCRKEKDETAAASLSGGSFRRAHSLCDALVGRRSTRALGARRRISNGPGRCRRVRSVSLLAAVGGPASCPRCRAVARASNFAFISLDLSGSGTVDRKDGVTRFTEITLRTRLKLPANSDPDRAKKIRGQECLSRHGIAVGADRAQVGDPDRAINGSSLSEISTRDGDIFCGPVPSIDAADV